MLYFRMPPTKRLILFIIAIFAAVPLYSQKAQTDTQSEKSPSPDSTTHTQGSKASPSPTPQLANQQQLERLAKVADKVLDKIQSEENDLYARLNYFEKSERLDPNSYASKDEIVQWRRILQQLKAQHDKVAELYANVAKELDAALKSAGENEDIAARLRN
jgi:hypothetical protein